MVPKIINFLSPALKYCNKRNFVFVALVLSVFFLTWCDGTNGTWEGKNAIVEFSHWAMQIIWAMLWLLTALVTLMIHPGWYNGEFFDMFKYFKMIWVLVSNVVYFVFAFILIWLAFMNIIGKGEWDYELKKALPKFIVWILIVPFSWFLVQFILSLSSILMVALISLPYDSFEQYWLFQKYDNTQICTDFTINLWTPDEKQTGAAKWFDCPDSSKKPFSEVLDPKKSIYWIVWAYTYGILRLDKLNEISAELSGKTVKNITDLALKTIFDLVFIAVYWVLMLALFLALFVRWVWIWMFIMFSPIFWLLYFFNDKQDGMLWSFKEFSFGKFISLAFVPAYVWAALSFWLVFLLVISNGMQEQSIEGNKVFSCSSQNSEECTIDIGAFKFRVKWALSDAVGVASWTWQVARWAIGALIVNIFWLAVLWMAVIAALKSNEITGKIIEPIAKFGESIWEVALNAPQYIPMVPGPGGALWSAQTLWKFWRSVANIPEQYASDQYKVWEKNTPFLQWWWGITPSEKDDILRSLREVTNKNDSNLEALRGKILTWAEKKWTWFDPNAREVIEEYLKKLNEVHGWSLLSKEDLENIFTGNRLSDKAAQLILSNPTLISKANPTQASSYALALYNWWENVKRPWSSSQSSVSTSTSTPTPNITWWPSALNITIEWKKLPSTINVEKEVKILDIPSELKWEYDEGAWKSILDSIKGQLPADKQSNFKVDNILTDLKWKWIFK